MQVFAFMFGSVPLRTYLPDGDIDISIFTPLVSSTDPIRESWTTDLLRALEKEGSRRDAPFRIINCQLIQAEVKLVKCVVANVVVDISFNALGGICTVAFLEWVDRIIGCSHLFKRSIVLVKAWCYYEARLLGAHHSLISSYGLEAMVLYIFNLYGKGLNSPLQVLQKFLQVFSNFDWDSCCLSMLGPIPLSSFPYPYLQNNVAIGEQTLLKPQILREGIKNYSVQPKLALTVFDSLITGSRCEEINEDSINNDDEKVKTNFTIKFLNIMDPLLPSNNLGRSVSKASFARIKKAMSYGARDLDRILYLEPLAAAQSIDAFFRNAWRSPTRMAADNQLFQQRLATGGAAYMQRALGLTNCAASSQVLQQGYATSRASTGLSRSSNSISVPDLYSMGQEDSCINSHSNTQDHQSGKDLVLEQEIVQKENNKNMPTRKLSENNVIASNLHDETQSLSATALLSLDNCPRSKLDADFRQSVSQPVSPTTSSHAKHMNSSGTGLSRMLEAVPGAHNLKENGNAAVRESNQFAREPSRNLSNEAFETGRTSSYHTSLPVSPVKQRELHPSTAMTNGALNINLSSEANRFPVSSYERAKPGSFSKTSVNLLHGTTIGKDNFTSDMDDLTQNLMIARACQNAPTGSVDLLASALQMNGNTEAPLENKQVHDLDLCSDNTTKLYSSGPELNTFIGSRDLSHNLKDSKINDHIKLKAVSEGQTGGMNAKMASLPSLRVNSVVRHAPDPSESYALVTAQGLTPSGSDRMLAKQIIDSPLGLGLSDSSSFGHSTPKDATRQISVSIEQLSCAEGNQTPSSEASHTNSHSEIIKEPHENNSTKQAENLDSSKDTSSIEKQREFMKEQDSTVSTSSWSEVAGRAPRTQREESTRRQVNPTDGNAADESRISDTSSKSKPSPSGEAVRPWAAALLGGSAVNQSVPDGESAPNNKSTTAVPSKVKSLTSSDVFKLESSVHDKIQSSDARNLQEGEKSKKKTCRNNHGSRRRRSEDPQTKFSLADGDFPSLGD